MIVHFQLLWVSTFLDTYDIMVQYYWGFNKLILLCTIYSSYQALRYLVLYFSQKELLPGVYQVPGTRCRVL